MIRISLGNVGSGKTASEVLEIAKNRFQRKTYSNIVTKIKHAVVISPEMIIKKEVVDSKTNKKTGESQAVYDYSLNKEFWFNIKEPLNVVLDEAHSILNARRSMSKTNVIVTDWLALIRRVLGNSDAGYGELVFITQLPNRIDNIARDMATQIRYHICHYNKACKKCNLVWNENSEIPERISECPRCKSFDLKKFHHVIEIIKFKNIGAYEDWRLLGLKTYYARYLVNDIETYFPLYDTLQWDNLFENFY